MFRICWYVLSSLLFTFITFTPCVHACIASFGSIRLISGSLRIMKCGTIIYITLCCRYLPHLTYQQYIWWINLCSCFLKLYHLYNSRRRVQHAPLLIFCISLSCRIVMSCSHEPQCTITQTIKLAVIFCCLCKTWTKKFVQEPSMMIVKVSE